ncbi:U-box domain-containing protein 35 [Malania oleifera]|uniref:U-box domain-containing protein 35 n=1 Tax=Malania oleifera TaxID=397392 RepID=UPI0025AE9859|nr:U-box domain-containing protein 35 [Malania oleifera]
MARHARGGGGGEGGKKGNMIAVAIDRDRGSQYALKWAIDHIASRTQAIALLHVNEKMASPLPSATGSQSSSDATDEVARAHKQQCEHHAKELFSPFRCFCARRDMKCHQVILEDSDVSKALVDYVTDHSIEILVMGAPLRHKTGDITSNVKKNAPRFCEVYVVSREKMMGMKSNSHSRSGNASFQHQSTSQSSISETAEAHFSHNSGSRVTEKSPSSSDTLNEDTEIKSPFGRGRTTISKSHGGRSPLSINRPHPLSIGKLQGDHSPLESDISFVSSGRPSTDHMSPFYENLEFALTHQHSNSSDTNYRLYQSAYSPGAKPSEHNYSHDFSSNSGESGTSSWPSPNTDDVEAEMRRLKLELKQTMDMYSTACKEALSAKQQAKELHRWKIEEEHKIEEARLAEEYAFAMVEQEKAKCRAAIQAAEAAQKIAEREALKRMNAEKKALREAGKKKRALDALAQNDARYRKYSINEIESATESFLESRKIGEGGYGPVYKCYLDHTPVAVKVLRPDAAQGRSQFQQEVEILSCIRHPNMVLLLGACPEYGCLVYEYMANGSLEDRLFRRGNTPVLPWQLRFRIAAEIGTGLLFLHQTKPEPLVHRDLKPANILLDRNYVSKISDVGLARLVPQSVSNNVTQYRMTSTAGTFCYIDPEYQQTGMLGIKSDIYSLGIMLLQIITAKPPMGLTHHVEASIERGTFAQMLDPAVPDWPMEETLHFAKLSLQCAELRRKDRPDLGMVVLPELNKLRALAEQNMHGINLTFSSPIASPTYSQISKSQVS